MSDDPILYVKVSGQRAQVTAKTLGYNPYRQDMSRKCAICKAPPNAFCVATMHRDRNK